ncbi:porin family protein [Adhaeribacter soli]|uniref:PorT family protein n=1 Tax=Adhaeribacter soli TaxID=2607655 RepID=A0A5N1J628_9BACT|nr:porin family protein [Adhaeribacter soli]KAA9340637.1 PorT family protein [Adhaeribacter soli]
MKKCLCLFTFFSFFLFKPTVYAQQIRNAIVIGASASQIDGDRQGGFDKAGLVFGGSSNFKINEKFSFQPEILFLQKGSKSDTVEYGDPNAFYKWRLNYVSVPLLLNYKIQPKFTLQAGLAADYLLSAKVDVGVGFEDRTEDLQKFDLNYMGGVEYRIWDNFAANARYQYSVKWLDDLHFKNSNVVVTLRFYLGGGE